MSRGRPQITCMKHLFSLLHTCTRPRSIDRAPLSSPSFNKEKGCGLPSPAPPPPPGAEQRKERTRPGPTPGDSDKRGGVWCGKPRETNRGCRALFRHCQPSPWFPQIPTMTQPAPGRSFVALPCALVPGTARGLGRRLVRLVLQVGRPSAFREPGTSSGCTRNACTSNRYLLAAYPEPSPALLGDEACLPGFSQPTTWRNDGSGDPGLRHASEYS